VDPCYALWASFLDQQWASAPPTRVLDVCCGTGLMTAELVAREMTVVGVDASPAMLAGARARLGDDLELLECVLPDLPVDGTFDAAVSTLDGLNYLTLPDFTETVAAVSRVLNPGGWFIFDVHGPGALDFARANPVIRGEQGGSTFTLSSTLTGRTCEVTIDFEGPAGEAFTETHTQHLHAMSDVEEALRAVGLEVVAILDEYTDRPITSETLRTTWVTRRPEG